MKRPIVLRGKKIGLAMMLKSDIPTITEWNQDLAFTAGLGSPGEAQTIEQREGFFESGSKMSSDSVEFSFIDLENNELVGFGGLFEMSSVNGAAVLFLGVAPSVQKRGFGTEGTKLLCEYGFFFRNLHNIRLQVKEYNRRAIAVYERVGFKTIGRIRGAVLLNGKRYDEVLMDLLRDELKPEYLAGFLEKL